MQLPSVALVLHRQLQGIDTVQIGEIVSSYLGPCPKLSLHHACSFGSIELLDWVWGVEDTTAQWSLNKHLRSNPHYCQWEFAEAVNVAVEMGNMEILRWLFEHFSDCAVENETVRRACKHGRLNILQWLLDNESDAPGNWVQWNGAFDIVVAVRNEQLEAARWLVDHIPIESAYRNFAVRWVLESDAVDIARLILPEGRHILEFAGCYLQPNVVALRLDSDHAIPFTEDDDGLASIWLKHFVCDEQLDLLQRVVQVGDQPDFKLCWDCVLHAACNLGKVTTLQWLLEQLCCQKEVEKLKSSGRLYELVCEAAEVGDVEMMQYLYDQDLIDKYGNALLAAIRKDQMSSVKWILRQFPKSERVPDYCVLDEAAKFGRLDMLHYFESIAAYGAFSNQTANMVVAKADHYLNVSDGLTVYRSRWCSTDAMDDAAANSHLKVVKWLHFRRREGCSSVAMDCAAANGHLEVVKWLYANSPEGCTVKAMDGAAAHGHLEVMQWLHVNTSPKSSKEAMDHLNVLKWLYMNRSEGCSAMAIRNAVSNGHFYVVCWLHKVFPDLTPGPGPFYRCRRFDIMLFIRESFPKMNIRTSARIPLSYVGKNRHIVDWLMDGDSQPASRAV